MYCSDENTHIYQDHYASYPKILNVWMGILRDHITGSVFINDNLNEASYLNLLQENVGTMITEVLEEELVFQLVVAPPHLAAAAAVQLISRSVNRSY